MSKPLVAVTANKGSSASLEPDEDIQNPSYPREGTRRRALGLTYLKKELLGCLLFWTENEF